MGFRARSGRGGDLRHRVPSFLAIQGFPPSLGRCVDGGALGSQIPVPSALLVYLVNPFCMCWSGVL